MKNKLLSKILKKNKAENTLIENLEIIWDLGKVPSMIKYLEFKNCTFNILKSDIRVPEINNLGQNLQKLIFTNCHFNDMRT